jgi:phage gp36-like protein
MFYITLNDLLEELGSGKLLELIGIGNAQIDTAKAEAAIASATDLVNAYIGVRYQIPIETVPEIVRYCAKNIAIYYLYLYKHRDLIIPIEVTNQKNEALRILAEISNGCLDIGLTAKSAKNIAYSNEKYFSREHLDEFKNYRE